MEIFGKIFWLLIILVALQPLLQRRLLDSARMRVLRRIERREGGRVITLIHRQETMGILGFPLLRYIDVNDSEEVIRAIRLTDDDVPVDLVLHTPGGLALAAHQIACALQRHPARTRVFVPHMAMSGGTLIALAADEIHMDENAVLGPVDPQLGEFPAVSVLKVVEQKSIDEIDDRTLVMADVARKAIDQMHACVAALLSGKLPEDRIQDVATKLANGEWTHDHPIDVESARRLGLPVQAGIPDEMHQLMGLYPQPVRHSPTVQYVPEHYQKKARS